MNLEHEADMPRRGSRENGACGWLGWWATYVLAVLVAAVLRGGSTVEITAASFGIPLAWFTGWTRRRSVAWGYAMAATLVIAGAVVGFLSA